MRNAEEVSYFGKCIADFLCMFSVKQNMLVYCFLIVLQRLNEARRMMDKLRACIVANYYASAGMTRVPEVCSHITGTRQLKAAMVLCCSSR